MLSADPTMSDPLNPQSWNRYSYVGNDPLTFTVPTGFSWLSNFFDDIATFVRAVLKSRSSALPEKPAKARVIRAARIPCSPIYVRRYSFRNSLLQRVGKGATEANFCGPFRTHGLRFIPET
jgi:hypothetical protein